MKDLFKKVLKKLKLAMTALALIASVGVHGQNLGKCGDNAWAEYDKKSETLYIRGTGRTWDFTPDGMPWVSLRFVLKNVILAEGITYAGEYLLWYMDAVDNLYLPSTLTEIGPSAFGSMNSLRSIIIPENVENISLAFAAQAPFDAIYCLSQTPPKTVVDGDFHTWRKIDKSKATLYVRSGSINKYKENSEWSGFKEVLPLDIFNGVKRVESVSLPERIEGKSGDKIQLTPTFKPILATIRHVSWKTTNPNIATVSENGLVTLEGSDDEVEIIAKTVDRGYTDTCTVRILSDNANLRRLRVDGVLPASSNLENTAFIMTIPSTTESVEITATPEDVRASVKIDQLGILNAGWNHTSIKITSESGRVEKVYSLSVYKMNNDARLKNLDISDGELSPEFDPDIKNYNITVKSGVDKIVIRGTDIYDSTTTVYESLATGNNTLILKSFAEDKLIMTEYVFNVYRQSNEAKLKGLSISQGSLEPAFRDHRTDYTLKVSKSYGKVSISGIPVHEKATANEHKNIHIKDTTIVIKSTSEDETQNMEYRIKVKPINNNTNLQSLQVEGYEITPEFQPSIRAYKAIIKPTDKEIYIKATPEDTNATVFGDIGYSYVTGNNIIYRISVKAEDKMTESLYTITAIKEEDKYETGIPAANQSKDEPVTIWSADGRFICTGDRINGKIKLPKYLKGVFIVRGESGIEKIIN